MFQILPAIDNFDLPQSITFFPNGFFEIDTHQSTCIMETVKYSHKFVGFLHNANYVWPDVDWIIQFEIM